MVDVLSMVRSGAASRPAVTPEDPYAAFWVKYDSIRHKINAIDLALNEVVRADDEVQRSQKGEQANQLREQLNETLRQVSGDAELVRRDLDQLKKEIDALNDELPGSPDVRLQRNHFHLLNNEFAQIVTRLTEVQGEIKSKFVKQVTRQFNIAGVNVQEADIERIALEDPGQLQQNIFQMRGGKQEREIADTYNQIAARHRDILEIERRLGEILDLFVQFAIVVREQGRMIDNIEANISQAHNYVAKGTKALEEAKVHQKHSRCNVF
jgi:t-SNARE complex subunit (syntaxin)